MTAARLSHANAASRTPAQSAEGRRVDAAFLIKWIASFAQIGGYAATAFDATPWNVYLFLVGLTGWLAVGAIWRDRAIVLIHLVALGVMAAGVLR